MRLNGIDRLKFVAAISVVLLHAGWLIGYNELLNSLTVQGLFRLAVPLFAIISGYFFASRDKPGSWSLWVAKLLVIYLVLMLLYAPYWYDTITSPAHFVYRMVMGYAHLWYLPAIAFAACITHFLWGSRYFVIAVFICAVAGGVLQYVDILCCSMRTDVFRNGVFFLFPFFATGYLFSKKLPQVSFGVVVAAIGCVLLESYFFYAFPPRPAAVNIMFSLYFACPVIFAYTIRKSRESDCRPRSWYALSDYIYFVHFGILNELRALGISDRIAQSVLAVILSIMISWILQLMITGISKRRFGKP